MWQAYSLLLFRYVHSCTFPLPGMLWFWFMPSTCCSSTLGTHAACCTARCAVPAPIGLHLLLPTCAVMMRFSHQSTCSMPYARWLPFPVYSDFGGFPPVSFVKRPSHISHLADEMTTGKNSACLVHFFSHYVPSYCTFFFSCLRNFAIAL